MVWRRRLKSAPLLVRRVLSSVERTSSERLLKVETVASVTAAPKPVIFCLYPDEVSSTESVHVEAPSASPAPATGASNGLSWYVLSSDEQYDVAAEVALGLTGALATISGRAATALACNAATMMAGRENDMMRVCPRNSRRCYADHGLSQPPTMSARGRLLLLSHPEARNLNNANDGTHPNAD